VCVFIQSSSSLVKKNELFEKEMDGLKELVQSSAREAGPLAKLLDFVFQDVILMEDEHRRWREESQKLEQEVCRLEM